jgi:hypothetical protein
MPGSFLAPPATAPMSAACFWETAGIERGLDQLGGAGFEERNLRNQSHWLVRVLGHLWLAWLWELFRALRAFGVQVCLHHRECGLLLSF